MVDKHLPSNSGRPCRTPGGWRMKDRDREVSPKSSQSAMSRRAGPGLNHGTEPPPQGPGGRCRGTYELCPSSSDA